MNVLKMQVIDAASAARALDGLGKPEENEITLGVLPEKTNMMQVTLEGKVMIFYVEEERAAQG